MENIVLDSLFEPESVAVIGASRTRGKVGHLVVANLLDAGYQGKIFPVNPSGGEILGLPVIPALEGLPEGLDLAVVCLPREQVLGCLEGLAARRTKAVILITAGFKEVGRTGWYLEVQVAALCLARGMALLGPNCLGLVNTKNGLNATFAAGNPERGNIAFFSQSGALCLAILDAALGKGIGFSKFISLGNKAILNETHLLNYLKDDPETKVILGYVENVVEGQSFLRAAQEATFAKPVIMIKSGTTAAGAAWPCWAPTAWAW